MASTQTLGSYITECKRLFHDATNRYVSNAEWTAYINDGRDRVASDTGCIRSLVSAYLSEGVEQYRIGGVCGIALVAAGSGFANGTYNLTITAAVGDTGTGAAGTYTVAGGVVTAITLTNTGSGYNAVPTVTFPSGGGSGATGTVGIIPADTLDILNITPTWGSQRYPLRYMPYTEFNAKMRTWIVNTQRPVVWSRYGTSRGTAFVQPIPDQIYVTEFDTAILPTDLAVSADPDVQLFYPYTTPVAYYACCKAKISQQAFGDAEIFLTDYKRKILEAQASTQMRRIPNPNNGYSGAA